MNKDEVINYLSPLEREILPLLTEKDINEIIKKSGKDKTSVLRALQFLGNKAIVKTKSEKKKIIDLGDNGVLYLKNGLPERRLLDLLAKNKTIDMSGAEKQAKLSKNEFKAAIGALKKKAMIELKNQKLILTAKMDEVGKKMLEEQFLEALPLEQDKLKPEQVAAFNSLKVRKNIIEIKEESQVSFELTDLGKQLVDMDLSKVKDMIETLSPEMIKKASWRGKKFRKYDVSSPVPKIYGGKRHFVNQAVDYARKIWTEMGFKEMSGQLTQTSFWNFDALFTAQDHPVRELQDTFFIKEINGKLPDKKLVQAVKKAHEKGVGGSKGWQYEWKEQEAKKPVLRTHTTCLSAQTLAQLKELKEKNKQENQQAKQGKFFAIGKCFRNETIDAGHLFEFNQTEGIVVDKDANFKHLLGYLKAFLNKMGFEKIRFRPHFFPYTEPSVEADVYNEKTGKWVEILGAGIFRPEVTIPLLGEWVPVLAWGMGFDRLVMENYKIRDIRNLYKNDINKLREMKFWIK